MRASGLSPFHTLSVAIVLLLFPASAWAIQEHGGPEGLHAHQMAHLFFAFSMGLLIYWLRKRRLVDLQGWRFIQYAALFFIIWNIAAFTGHWLEEQSGLIEVRRSALMRLHISAAADFGWVVPIYYAAKLDHLVSVPALIFLCLGLRRLLHAPGRLDQG